MPKIVFVGQIGWLVANTKTKRIKLKKKTKIKTEKKPKKLSQRAYSKTSI